MGDEVSPHSFMSRSDLNGKNIKLSWQWDRRKVIFLDLEIMVTNGCLITKKYFKLTDHNSFIHLDSCHHRSCLFNIPRGQFIYLHGNRTTEEDFLQKSEILEKRFIQKGYSQPMIREEI